MQSLTTLGVVMCSGVCYDDSDVVSNLGCELHPSRLEFDPLQIPCTYHAVDMSADLVVGETDLLCMLAADLMVCGGRVSVADHSKPKPVVLAFIHAHIFLW